MNVYLSLLTAGIIQMFYTPDIDTYSTVPTSKVERISILNWLHICTKMIIHLKQFNTNGPDCVLSFNLRVIDFNISFIRMWIKSSLPTINKTTD